MKTLLPILFTLIFLPTAFSATFYLDPVNGNINNNGSSDSPWSTLEEVVNNNFVETQEYSPLPYDPANSQLVIKNAGAVIKAGDTLMLRNGLHGTVLIDRHYNADFITIMAAPGHTPILAEIRFRAAKNWKLSGLEISSEPYGYYTNYRLVYIESHSYRGPSSDFEITDCNIYSTTNSSSWTAQDWLDKVSGGISINGDRVHANNNILTNVSMGITITGADCSAINNQIINFSADGMRALGKNILLEGNLIKNCYDIDDNHDDGIQSFNLNYEDYSNVVIRGNTIINFEDPNQPLRGPLQGIGCFDGPYNDWIIENNVIAIDHYHGISLYGAYNCMVRNNTVIDLTPDETPGPAWIRITDHKDGTPSAGCVVANNVANTFSVDGLMLNNYTVDDYVGYEEHFVDYLQHDFRLKPGSAMIDAGDDTNAALTDILSVSRPQGISSDIGAYEYTSAADIDTDGDTVFDSEDDCPNEPGYVEANGCPCLKLNLKVLLEGPLDKINLEMSTILVNERKILPGQTPSSPQVTPTPAGQPYQIAPWNYQGLEGSNFTDADYAGNVVDWILISIRTSIDKADQVAQVAGLLLKDGTIQIPANCELETINPGPFYIVIEHRSHMGIMSPAPVLPLNGELSYDFSTQDAYKTAASTGQKQFNNVWAMLAGDINQVTDVLGYDINGADKGTWIIENGLFDIYTPADLNLDGDINGGDKSIWLNNNGNTSAVPK